MYQGADKGVWQSFSLAVGLILNWRKLNPWPQGYPPSSPPTLALIAKDQGFSKSCSHFLHKDELNLNECPWLIVLSH